MTNTQIESLAEQLAGIDSRHMTTAEISTKCDSLIGHLDQEQQKVVWSRAMAIADQLGKQQREDDNTFQRLRDLALASGMTAGEPIIPWLLNIGLIEKFGPHYRLTAKGNAFVTKGSLE
jgi:hypothetical protein